MRHLLGWILVLAIPVAFIGCAEPGRFSGNGNTPCEQCTYGYVPVKKSMERRVWCVVDGKMVDCQKNPTGCPECSKLLN